ncbi:MULTISPECIES: hypothetical protein [Metabacillus]|uniref:hypothetical protein n=1 Tax=Metabacillus TaxID=2675233 RepID=UPI000C80B8C7|nr:MULTISPECIES: hypothetical protein [Metabacillus]MCM3444005.1 hypothetical protein [Metabacillus halosaccharovorans]PMC34946.1 hypothetical protein CJ195_20780 [Bacillus sp. UMB0899]
MKPFKGRSVELGMLVDVYRNLHQEGYSIRDSRKGVVLAHCDSVRLISASFKVSESGRLKTVHEKRRRVHAFIRGTLVGIDEPMGEGFSKVYYNPFHTEKFIDTATETNIDSAEEVYCTGKFAFAKRRIFSYE